MRTSAFLPALLIAASASAAVNTQVNGLTLTNGLSSLSDTSGLYNGPNTATGVTYLTDNDTTTFNFNIGDADGGSVQGSFGGSIASTATGIYLIGLGSAGSWNNYVAESLNGPSFSVQLALLGGLSASRTYGDANFTITTQRLSVIDGYQNANGMIYSGYDGGGVETMYYAYAYIPFADFNATYDQVVGIKLGNFTSAFPDISYIGVGYTGGAPVPEPSTYGLALGGLALAGAITRRRRSKSSK